MLEKPDTIISNQIRFVQDGPPTRRVPDSDTNPTGIEKSWDRMRLETELLVWV